MEAPLPGDEAQRLAALYEHALLETAPTAEFDDLVRLAAHVCGVPIAAVSLVDEHRQWFKSIVGLGITETPRQNAFCAHTILQPDMLVVPDAQDDPRFADNPLVTGDPRIRFYAGAPLVTEDGYALGSLCVIDRTPRQLTPEQQETLRLLARQVTAHLKAARRVAEREYLVQEKERLAAIVESAGEAILAATLDGTITSWNRAAERLYGYTAAEMVGQHVSRLARPGEESPVPAVVTRLRRGETIEPIELTRCHRDGTPFHASLSFSPIRDAAGCMVGVSCVVRDITARKKAEAALEAEREFSQAVLESLREGIAACDADGTLTLFNHASREFHDLPEQPLPPEQWSEHFNLYEADGITPMPMQNIPLFRALQGEVVRDAELVIAPKIGTVRTLLASGQALYDVGGQKIGAVIAMHDITARRIAEQEQARLAAIIETCEDAVYSAALDGKILSWNGGAERLYGYSAAEIIGQQTSLVPPEHRAATEQVMAAVIRSGYPLPLETVRLTKTGRIDVSLRFSPLRDTAGCIIGVSIIARDITDRKQAENALISAHAALAESEVRLRRLTDAAFEGIGMSQDGVLLDVSPTFAAMFGYSTPAEMLGLTGMILAAPESRTRIASMMTENNETPYEATLQRRDGTTFQAEIRGKQIQVGGRPARMTAVRDISDRKRMEAALLESELRFRTSVDAMEEGMALQDADGTILMCNASAERILGLTADQMAGRTSLDPRWRAVHEDGTDFPGDRHPAMVALREGIPQRNVVMGVHKPSGELTWVNINAVPLLTSGQTAHEGAAGVRGVVVTFSDITERKQMEAEQQEYAERLRRSQAEMQAILESAPVILYAADADGIITLSEGTGLSVLGLKPGEVVGRSVYEFSGGDAEIEDYTRRALAGEAVSYDAHFAGLCLYTELRPVRDEADAVTGIIGVCFDMTERVASEERFRVLFEQSSDAHLLFDDQGIIDCNPATIALLRCSDKAQVLKLHPAVLSPEFQPDGRRSDEKCLEMDALAQQNGSHRFEWTHRKMDGEDFPVEVTLTPVTLKDRLVLLVVWHDLTERKRAEEQMQDYAILLEFQKNEAEKANAELEEANAMLENLATTDGLTGLHNHRTFQERLTEEVSRAARYATPLSLVLLDVDSFKSYNDSYGHPAGDAVLQAVAGVLQSCVRETDMVARYGGEEFVLILPQTDQNGAAIFAERLRAAVEGHPWPLRAVTASFGVACLHPADENGGELVIRADTALYRSKKSGRNRVTCDSRDVPLPEETNECSSELSNAAA